MLDAGLGVRMVTTFVVMLTSGFSIIECLWFAIAWTPKVNPRQHPCHGSRDSVACECTLLQLAPMVKAHLADAYAERTSWIHSANE